MKAESILVEAGWERPSLFPSHPPEAPTVSPRNTSRDPLPSPVVSFKKVKHDLVSPGRTEWSKGNELETGIA